MHRAAALTADESKGLRRLAADRKGARKAAAFASKVADRHLDPFLNISSVVVPSYLFQNTDQSVSCFVTDSLSMPNDPDISRRPLESSDKVTR
jgi:hypothetical protein